MWSFPRAGKKGGSFYAWVARNVCVGRQEAGDVQVVVAAFGVCRLAITVTIFALAVGAFSILILLRRGASGLLR